MNISICIPTYNRVEQLKEAVWSCINQTYAIDEIIIGDDSPNDDTKRMIEEEFRDCLKIVYCNNKPSLGQANNVNSIFKKAKSRYLILLHDDDLLLPEAVATLYNYATSNDNIDAVFGKQILITNSGETKLAKSEGLNQYFYRTAMYAGNVLTPLESGFLQQFPNDAYLIRTEVAQKIGYRESAGDACDFDFGLKLGMSGATLHFVNEYTAKYRISNQSISSKKVSDLALSCFLVIEKLEVPKSSVPYKIKRLKEMVPVALIDAINLKRKRVAFQLYFSKWHMEKILSLGGARRFLLLMRSLVK